MIYKEFLNEVRDDLSQNLNAFLSEIGLTPVSHFCTDGFAVEKFDRSLAVYAYSPNGPVYEDSGMSATARFTVEFFLNATGDENQLSELEEYFSALAFYLIKRRFGGNGIITDSQLSRMDQGDSCNECLFLVESQIDIRMDYGETYPIPEESDLP